MQQIIYDDRPEIVFWYENYLQAYRSDEWTGFVKQPTEDGAILFQYGYYSLLNIQPASEGAGTDAADGDGGMSALVWIAIAAVVVVIVGVVVTRRRGADEEA